MIKLGNQLLFVFDIKSELKRTLRKVDFIKHMEYLQGELLGEIFSDEVGREISLSNASHSISNIRIEGDYLIGDVKILDTLNGKIISENINNYVFRPRFVGVIGNDIEHTIKLERVITFDAHLSSVASFVSEQRRFSRNNKIDLIIS